MIDNTTQLEIKQFLMADEQRSNADANEVGFKDHGNSLLSRRRGDAIGGVAESSMEGEVRFLDDRAYDEV